MAFDPGALEATLANAIGDDPALVAELRSAFLESANAHVDILGRSRSDGNWRMAAWRLKGLAASFGAVRLMQAADEAAETAPGDPVAIRRVNAAISSFTP